MIFKVTNNKKSKFIKGLTEWFFTIAIAIIVALFVVSNIITVTQIKQQSMEPTFKEDDRVVVYKLGYFFDEPKRGDIIILNNSITRKGLFVNMLNEGQDIIDNISYRFTGVIGRKNLIKRVIGVPGDIIDISNGNVYINGKLEKGYNFNGKTYEKPDLAYPIEVSENKVFVLGDNRENSVDSRSLGLIDYTQVKGKVYFRVWPFNRLGKVE